MAPWTFYNSNGEALIQNAESVATQAEMEAATSTTAMVSAGRTQNHPGVAKASGQYITNQTPMVENAAYNISGHTDHGVGDHTFTFDTAFANVNYTFAASGSHANADALGIIISGYDADLVLRAVGSIRLWVHYGHYDAPVLLDVNDLDLVFFGDQ
jgi:hypothetical protein